MDGSREEPALKRLSRPVLFTLVNVSVVAFSVALWLDGQSLRVTLISAICSFVVLNLVAMFALRLSKENGGGEGPPATSRKKWWQRIQMAGGAIILACGLFLVGMGLTVGPPSGGRDVLFGAFDILFGAYFIFRILRRSKRFTEGANAEK